MGKTKEDARLYAQEYRKRFPDKVRISFNRSIKKHPETPRIVKRRWNYKNKIKKAELARNYRIKYPEKVKAHSIAQKIEIPLGEKCELCKLKLAQERHHPDYNSPLEVMFLCIECHRRIHLGR